MPGSEELVCLLDDDGRQVGVERKASVHTTTTRLHQAFSCHIFDAAGRTLVTRRALSKATWPGVWTNSVCGHPAPGETFDHAIRRRAADELGLELSEPTIVLPNFRYRAVDASGIVENELCPVFVARQQHNPNDALVPNPNEVCEWAWVDPASLERSVAMVPFAFSPWLVLQLRAGAFANVGFQRP
ncbi:isopentenyl-diphosphate Delta-isomerase [Paenarthrobacter sp. Z7-10]|uniref:isopentenyl-diphosphate Delta-isomerase n=1 Tax=Paenarthrobacter sp. Z7-10 TaxID=2787635 RepID=UPI0022A92672|nr:isopentenyl-diphosphate Delta-isomerase [Paenarthrobacter sp. Z7-10]MCZ2402228.1 isopentenyl-diphosphate Delta-isomerase [Paenarthrobacter sp. Z7-10]